MSAGSDQGKMLNKGFVILAAGCLVWFGIWIMLFPWFYLDDYYIFYLLSKNGALWPADPSFPFYLHYRPVTFIYLKMLSVITTAPHIMKILQLCVLLLTYLISAKTIKLILERFGCEIKPLLVLLPLGLIASQPDSLLQILWISNFNELISLFFYVLSAYLLLKSAVAKSQVQLLIVSLFAYLAAALSKQQALHLPVLAGAAFLMFPEIRGRFSKRNSVALLLAGILFAVIFSVWHAAGSAANTGLARYLWTKPFAIAGTLFYMLSPALFNVMRDELIQSRVWIMSALLVVLVVMFIKLKAGQRGLLLKGIIMTLIIFFPRFLYDAGERLNSIQLFWLAVVLSWLLHRYSSKKALAIGIVIMLFGANIYASAEKIIYLREDAKAQRESVEALRGIMRNESRSLVLMPYVPVRYSAEYYYCTRGNFGQAEFTLLPIYYDKPGSIIGPAGMIEASLNGNSIHLACVNPAVSLNIDRLLNMNRVCEITGKTVSADGRGFATITIAIAEGMEGNNIFCYDGLSWRQLK